MKHLILISTLCCLASAAHAQSPEYKSGLNYTTLGSRTQSAPKTEDATAPVIEGEAQTEAPEADAATRIWNKYKDLATGAAAEDAAKSEKGKIAKAPEKPEKPSVDTPEKPQAAMAKTEEKPVSKSGITALLEEWKQNKKQQSEMRSMSFNTPKAKTSE